MERYNKVDTLHSYSHSYAVGLRNYMQGVYLIMATGLAITGLAAFLLSILTTTNDITMAAGQLNGLMLTDLGVTLYTSGFKYVLMFAPLVMVLFLQLSIARLSASAVKGLFLAFSVAMGLSLSNIFLIYTQTSIVQVFFITAAAFSGLSLYGYVTQRDLSPLRTFFVMSLIGLLVALLLNAFFFQSTGFNLLLSVAGVLLFAGLTAYDTQRIKTMYAEFDDGETTVKKITSGALVLYLDFINIFIFLLQLIGNKRD